MDKEQWDSLAVIRMERARELLGEVQELLEKNSYKSANSRAFYAIEKCVKALLATEQVEVLTHNGAMKMFNMKFIHSGDGNFTAEDYRKIAKAEQIRNASDYDDFYIASREETRQQVENALYFVEKVEMYLVKK